MDTFLVILKLLGGIGSWCAVFALIGVTWVWRRVWRSQADHLAALSDRLDTHYAQISSHERHLRVQDNTLALLLQKGRPPRTRTQPDIVTSAASPSATVPATDPRGNHMPRKNEPPRRDTRHPAGSDLGDPLNPLNPLSPLSPLNTTSYDSGASCTPSHGSSQDSSSSGSGDSGGSCDSGGY